MRSVIIIETCDNKVKCDFKSIIKIRYFEILSLLIYIIIIINVKAFINYNQKIIIIFITLEKYIKIDN